MRNAQDGDLIDWVEFPDTTRRDSEIVRSGLEGQLVWHESNLGDHGEHWVLRVKNGTEVLRFNARYISTVCWSTPDGEVNAIPK
jgi:hypothetical protein